MQTKWDKRPREIEQGDINKGQWGNLAWGYGHRVMEHMAIGNGTSDNKEMGK